MSDFYGRNLSTGQWPDRITRTGSCRDRAVRRSEGEDGDVGPVHLARNQPSQLPEEFLAVLE
jgi:hypothetical protein